MADDKLIAEVLKFDPMRQEKPAEPEPEMSQDDVIAEVLKFDPMRKEQPQQGSPKVVGGYQDTDEISAITGKRSRLLVLNWLV